MATYLVERYWPGLDQAGAQAETARLTDAGVLVIETIVASADEVCYWYVVGASAHGVEVAFAASGVRFDRVGAATQLPKP